MKVGFYPGCSLLGTAKEYLSSTKDICAELGIELVELPDWTCCGASSAHALSYQQSVLLPARNLAIAEDMGLPVVTPCSACYSRLKIAQKEIRENEDMKNKVSDILKKSPQNVEVYHLLEYIMGNEDVKEKIKSSIDNGLGGLKIASYYGCLITRPQEATGADEVEVPFIMDELVDILGGEPVDWAMKTECCGASLSLSKSGIVKSLVSKIIDYAQRSGAQAILTACPLCQLNLEMRRSRKQIIPVYYFTELIGIAQENKNVKEWLGDHLVDARTILHKNALL